MREVKGGKISHMTSYSHLSQKYVHKPVRFKVLAFVEIMFLDAVYCFSL